MTRYKRVLFYGLMAALTLASIEGLARLAYFLAFDQWYGGGLPATDSATFPEGAAGASSPLGQHPFFGYAYYSTRNDLNRMPPRSGSDDIVVIGLLGGSVANALTFSLSDALERHFAAKDLPRRPVLLRLAGGGMKQPQQAIAAAKILSLGGHFDILVNLDGHNEITHSRLNLKGDLFPFFPLKWHKNLGLTEAETLLAGQIGLLRREQGELARAAAAHPFRYSAAFALLYRYRLQRTENRIIQLNHTLADAQTAYSLEKHGPRYPFQWQSAEMSGEEVQSWYRGSLLLAELAELAGAEYHHFLQPNQYVPGAKPLTPDELACCYERGGEVAAEYRGGYPLLRQFGEKLQQQGVNYRDLSGIFADNRETLYRDECCHINNRGNELLAAAIVERLAPALRRAATAAPPPVAALTPAARPRTDELLIDADFQVYRRAGYWLRYVKEDCSPQDTAARFFLHITPADPADLPTGRQEYGFDNLDFQFAEAGITFNGQCIVELLLSRYPVAALRTGQFRSDGTESWAGEYHFQE